jgi:hypothetical protein
MGWLDAGRVERGEVCVGEEGAQFIAQVEMGVRVGVRRAGHTGGLVGDRGW